MPIAPTYPGVYIEELPSGVHTITGVSTSVTAFLGYFKRGTMNAAMQVFSMADVERNVGKLDPLSDAGYALSQFFANGGSEAWVVRVASGTPIASAIWIQDKAGASGVLVLDVTAASEGSWGDNVRFDIEFGTTDPTSTTTRFNLVVSELDQTGPTPRVANTEIFRNLTLDPADSNYAIAVVNDGSKVIRLSQHTPASPPVATTPPAATGTVGTDIKTLPALNKTDNISLKLVKQGATTDLGSFKLDDPQLPATAAELASVLQSKIRGLKDSHGKAWLPGATVSVIGSASTKQFLQAKAGDPDPAAILQFSGAGIVPALGLDDPTRTNVQQYALGSSTAAGAQTLPKGAQVKGADGTPPTDGTPLLGDLATKQGIFALENVDIFNILCLPDVMNLDDSSAGSVITAAEQYCEKRRAFFILDVPQTSGHSRVHVDEIKAWLDVNATLRHKNAALYYPRPLIPDPLKGFRPAPRAPSGTIAGLYARIDADRGVWKAPAGTEAALRGVSSLEYKLTDAENGTLNPTAINCLRTFPVFGNVCWGARTLEGDDQIGSEWKYIPVRRTALFIEESLYRGTKWVVFEPNDEPLWAQIRLNIGAFMHDLFRKGAFEGQTPDQAYFVKCDKDTTTQTDIDHGIVNILVGFAPLKPAEFVIIEIQQIAGQIAT
jgi:phage tail sheath protein FI